MILSDCFSFVGIAKLGVWGLWMGILTHIATAQQPVALHQSALDW